METTKEKYLPTIGLEIHAELKTASKMFCSCRNNPDEEKPNVNICPICMSHPGTLPVLNMEAIRHVLKVGISIDGHLADFTEWDRKNYFYPDIPKGYQISQFKYPLVSGGKLANVSVERIHLEEDTAQSTHDTHENSLVNFNRAGVPLMELVTKPVIHDAATAVAFAKELQLLLRYLGAGDANLEKGEMRVEANISLSPIENGYRTSSDDVTFDFSKLGTKTEVKNLNSFRAVEKAIEYEIERQASVLDRGEKVVQETRGWDDNASETYSQRSKENSHDYRYFPEPDIPKLKISEIEGLATETLKKELPELPWVKNTRYTKNYSMTEKEVAVFIDSPELANYFEKIITPFATDSKNIKLTINYLLTDYLGILKKALPSKPASKSDADSMKTLKLETIPSGAFTGLIKLVSLGKISSRGAKDLLVLLSTSSDPSIYIEETALLKFAETKGLIQQSNAADLVPAIEKIISDNANVVTEYKAGKVTSLQFLIGQAMKATRGAANPEIVKKLLLERL